MGAFSQMTIGQFLGSEFFRPGLDLVKFLKNIKLTEFIYQLVNFATNNQLYEIYSMFNFFANQTTYNMMSKISFSSMFSNMSVYDVLVQHNLTMTVLNVLMKIQKNNANMSAFDALKMLIPLNDPTSVQPNTTLASLLNHQFNISNKQ